MYSLNQSKFTFQDNCCWLACAMTMLHNNVLKTPVTDIDIKNMSRFATQEYGRPLGNSGSPVKAGINVVKPYAKKYHNVLTRSMKVIRGLQLRNLHLNKGRCIAVNIQSSDEFKAMRWNGNKIEGDFTGARGKYGHWLCIFRKDGKDYFLNSWTGDSRDIKEVDLNVVGLFKNNEATVLY